MLLRLLPLCLFPLLTSCGWLAPQRPTPPADMQCVHAGHNRCFIQLPGGSTLLGAQSSDPAAPGYDPDAQPNEGPVRRVDVPSFWLMQEEVPWREWERCVAEGACPQPGDNAPQAGMGDATHYVSNVIWSEAVAICTFIGGRLPTEAEWAHAARGTEGRRYPWGEAEPCGLGQSNDPFTSRPPESWKSVAGCADLEEPATPRKGSPESIRELAWAHWEWVADELPDGRRIQRGGAWTAEDGKGVRAAVRTELPGDTRTFDAGVRCAW